MNSLQKQKINGAILGWMIGDALGTTLEFKKSKDAIKIFEYYSNFVNGLPGAGPFELSPGQFTDDTEMGLANMSIIRKIGHYDRDQVAKSYHSWYRSNPFDIGNTTRNAVSKPTAIEMLQTAKQLNKNSMSNGFLMRLPPCRGIAEATLLRRLLSDQA